MCGSRPDSRIDPSVPEKEPTTRVDAGECPVRKATRPSVAYPSGRSGAMTAMPTGPEVATALSMATENCTLSGSTRGLQPPESKPPAASGHSMSWNRRRGGFLPPVGRLERGCPPFAHRAFVTWGPSPWTKRGQPARRSAPSRRASTATVETEAVRVVHGTEDRTHLLIGVRSNAVHAVGGATGKERRWTTRGTDPGHPRPRVHRHPPGRNIALFVPTERPRTPGLLPHVFRCIRRCKPHATKRPPSRRILLTYTVHCPIL